MLGFIFTELVEFVETVHGEELTDHWLDSCQLASGGAFAATDSYSAEEIAELVGKLSQLSGTPVPDLLCTFGEHLFGFLARTHERVIRSIDDPLDLLENLDEHIHVEVCKLYPQAEVPRFTARRVGPDEMVLRYESSRALPDLAEGLIRGAAKHFGRTVEIRRDGPPGGSGETADFHVRMGPARE